MKLIRMVRMAAIAAILVVGIAALPQLQARAQGTRGSAVAPESSCGFGCATCDPGQCCSWCSCTKCVQ